MELYKDNHASVDRNARYSCKGIEVYAGGGQPVMDAAVEVRNKTGD